MIGGEQLEKLQLANCMQLILLVFRRCRGPEKLSLPKLCAACFSTSVENPGQFLKKRKAGVFYRRNQIIDGKWNMSVRKAEEKCFQFNFKHRPFLKKL